MRLTPVSACARVASGADIAASAAAITVRRSIMAASPADGVNDSASRTLQPLKMALCGWRTPGRLQERHVVVAPLADRLRAGALEGVFDRLGLADRDMQPEQRGRDRKRPSVQAELADMREQDRAGEDDQGIGEDEIFDL